MPKWLSPTDIQETFRISRAQSYKLMKAYIEANGSASYIQIGRLKRFPEQEFTDFLKRRGNEERH